MNTPVAEANQPVPAATPAHKAEPAPAPGWRLLGVPVTAWLFVLLTAATAVLWSHFKLLSQDEMFVLQTDSVPSLRQVVDIQHVAPISLDPLVYHSLAHLATRVVGPGATALRAPALLGYLLMQVCLFLVLRRMAGERAGVLAIALTGLTQTVFYAAEGRPYGLLLGLTALVLLAWQRATRAGPGQPRTAALVTLAVATALLLNTHYFAVLLMLPLCGAELVRTVTRRRVDLPVVAAILAGMAGIAAALPFQHAAGEFRKHYYNAGSVGLRAVTQAYRSLFVDYTHTGASAQRLAAAAVVLAALALVAGFAVRWRRGQIALPAGEMTFVLLLAALPFFGFLLARFVTHSIEVRYVLGAIVGLAILFGLTLAPALQRRAAWAAAVAGLAVATIVATGFRLSAEKRNTATSLAELHVSPEQKAAVLASPTGRLYVQDLGRFETAQYYQPDLDLRRRTTLVYSSPLEIAIDGHDTEALTAEHLQRFSALPIVPYEQLRTEPGEHIFVLYHSGWDWTDTALDADHARLRPLGSAAGGDATAVTFLPPR